MVMLIIGILVIVYVVYNGIVVIAIIVDALKAPKDQRGEGTLRSILFALFLALPIHIVNVWVIWAIRYFRESEKNAEEVIC